MADSLASLSRRQRATEEAFFKAEQEKAVMEYLEKMMAMGRDMSKIQAPKPSTSASILPQVMAQNLRLERPEKAEERRMRKFFRFQEGNRPKHYNPSSVINNPMYVSKATLGSQVSLGRSKWSAGTDTVQGASIFDVRKGAELANSAPEHVRQQVVKPAAPVELVSVGKVKLRLMPDYTPGRALMWGSVLAVWGTAAIVLRSAKSLEIGSLEEVPAKLGEVIRRPAKSAVTALDPIKQVATALKESDSAAAAAFSNKLKSTLVK